MFIREKYLEKILKYLDNNSLIKILIWQRRAWKSYIMKQIINFLSSEKWILDKNILYINLEIDFLKYKTIKDLDIFIKTYLKENNIQKRVYLFIDEVQELVWWEKLINSYRADDNFDCDIFITGSNASLLSSELSTYLSWRYISFEIYPFSYDEFLWYFNKESNKQNFLEYLNFSWISELYKLPDEETKTDFLNSLKDTIILKDIVKRFKLKEVQLLEDLFLFCISNISNISNLLSINSIVKKLKWQWIKSNTITIWNYLRYLEETFILHSCQRYDLQWKKILEWEKKYYLNDLWFKNYFFWKYDSWLWKELENIVFLHFKRLWYQVYTWNIWNLEIDFVVEKWKERKYIQVAYLISDESVLDREFWNLLKIKDNYEKIVLSLDDILVKDYKWIKHFNIWTFLTKK